MKTGTKRVSQFENEQLRQILIEAEVQRFGSEELLTFVRSRLGRDISIETIYQRKRELKKKTQLTYLKLAKDRMAYISLYFEIIEEIKKYQKEQWRIYHLNQGKGFLQSHCLNNLHEFTKTLANLYDLLPALSMPANTYATLAKSQSKDGRSQAITTTDSNREPEPINERVF